MAIRHRGAAVIDVLQPCPTWNNIYTPDFYKQRLYRLDSDKGWDPFVRSPDPKEAAEKLSRAFERAQEWGERIPIGIFYVNPYVEGFADNVSKVNSFYESMPPAKNVIAREDGTPVIDLQAMRSIFREYIIEVSNNRGQAQSQ